MTRKLIATVALNLLFAAHANAASMSITGPTVATVGDSFQIEIWGDFSGEGLIAGAITFFWDDALVELDYVHLNLNTIPCDFPPCLMMGTSNSEPIGWGEFLSNLIEPGDPAPTLMATLGFTAVGAAASEALASFSMQDASDDFSGGWWGAGFSPIDVPSFGTFSMEIVPLPAAVWFMIGGLGTLLGFCRKRTT